MRAFPTPNVHIDEGSEPLVALLKSDDFHRRAGSEGQLPYRIDLLRPAGLRLGWTDAHLRRRSRRVVARLESLLVPFSQAIASRKVRAAAAATLAIFESEGHGLAAWRLALRRRRPPLVVVACWLSDLAVDGGRVRRTIYRSLYRAVDVVVVFSSNQVTTLRTHLDIDPSRVRVVRFGVDLDELASVQTSEGSSVVAVGRDLGRDWATLCSAAAGSGWEVDLVTRPSQLRGLDVPEEVTVRPTLPRASYLELLAGAGVVVVPSEVREYPTGQTVLLEAMALGKACVVSDSPAMREYVVDGETALVVDPHDPSALRAAVDRLLRDPRLRRAIGETARRTEAGHGGARTMWREVGEVIAELRAPAQGTAGQGR